MKFKMAHNSIFAVLLRSPWWISALIAAILVAGSQAIEAPVIKLFLFFAAIPFLVICCVSAWKRRNLPSAKKVEQTAERVNAMSWATFSAALQEGLLADGCEISPLKSEHADFELRRQTRIAIMSARRWKASRVGVQPLEKLNALREARGAHEAIFVTTGEISEQAAAYASAHQIKFLATSELAQLLPRH